MSLSSSADNRQNRALSSSTQLSATVRPSTSSMEHSDFSDRSVSERPESPTLPPDSLQGSEYLDALDSSRSSARSAQESLQSTSATSSRGMIHSSSSNSNASNGPEDMSQSPSPLASFHQINGGTHPHPGATSSHGSDKSRSSHSAASPAVKHTGHGLRKAVSSSNLPQHRVKRSLHTSDYLAAAIELNSSPNVAPAPAAGMYWSRAITYGRGPSRPLRAHTANLIGEQLYVFGGCDIKSCFNSLYILDMDTLTWSKPRVSGQIPPPCRAHSCTVVDKDLASGKRSTHLYVFGGGDGPNYFNDLYILNIDTLTWSKPPMEGTIPSPRRAHATCLWNDKIIVVGGGDGARALADVHALDISDPAHLRWTQLKPSGTPPIARGYHTSNLVKDKLIVYGGSDGHECFSDVHILDLVDNRWIHVDIDRAVPRLAHTATQVGSYIFVIGGHDGSRYSNDVLLLNLVTMSWESRKIYGGAPTPRGYHTTVLHDCRLYLLGGFDGRNVFEDVYVLELSACAYLPQITNFEVDA